MHYPTPYGSASTYHSCYPHYHSTGCGSVVPVPYPVYVPCYPGAYYPYSGGDCGTTQTTLPQELNVDATNNIASALIGGTVATALTLEYVPDSGASAPTVKVTVEHGGSTSTWEETAIPQGYHVKSQFLSVEPGDKVTLEVAETMARLRWCEAMCC